MKVSFIIPVYNHLDLTLECLRTLKETIAPFSSYEIVIVNDGCDEATTTGLRTLKSKTIRIVENGVNRGYAHSNNQGAVHATGKLLFLVNNDLVFQPGWFEPMLEAFEKLPTPGLIGNIQLNAKTGEIDHTGAYIDLDTTVKHSKTPATGIFGTPAYSRKHIVTGACCAIERTLFLRIGGFDEAFVNGGEDIDLCFRLADLGHRTFVANKSVVQHHVSATRLKQNENDERNSRLLQRRWKTKISHMAASRWPDHFIKEASENWTHVNKRILCSALSRFLLIKKGPAPIGITNALYTLEQNERHWKSRLNGWTDEMIKKEERKANASLRSEQYRFEKLYPIDDDDNDGVWIREEAIFTLPRGTNIASLEIIGKLAEKNLYQPDEKGTLGLKITVNETHTKVFYPIENGKFNLEIENPPVRANEDVSIKLELLGTGRNNLYAYLGRVLANKFYIPSIIRKKLAPYRFQLLNKRLAIHGLKLNGEDVFSFKDNPTSPLNTDYVIKHADMGINLVGWFNAELGIGESARVAAKALRGSKIPHELVPLKVNCLASQGDTSLNNQLTSENPHPVNIFHIDAPQSDDIDHHHGKHFCKDKYNIAYWAWELPEFPDGWIKHFKHFNEIWAPSNFVRDAIVMKSPIPVITVPHCIDFNIPDRDYRAELELPKDKFLFSFAYDLNSYQERKNPKAAIEAYKQAFAGTDMENDVGLVIKTHSSEKNQAAYKELLESLKGISNYYLIDKTLPRQMVYGLMQASDAYISLHRSEGFGLTVAESMLLGKPVVSTNWSATSEFVNAGNGCPIDYKLIKLETTHGPYQKGQIWADPDPADAAAHMYRLATDSEYAASLGFNAKKTIKELFSPERVGDIYRRRLRAITLW